MSTNKTANWPNLPEWKVIEWIERPKTTGRIYQTCTNCGTIATMPCGETPGGKIKWISAKNQFVFEPENYRPPLDFLPAIVQCKRCSEIMITRLIDEEWENE